MKKPKLCCICGYPRKPALIFNQHGKTKSVCETDLYNPNIWFPIRRLIPTDLLIKKVSRKQFKELNNFKQRIL